MKANREILRDKYEKWWPISNAREERIKSLLEESLHTKVVPYGMGALSSERIKGSARDNGFETADPDLYVEEYGCFVEVTGPLKPFIHPKDALFVNPCKIKNARKKAQEGYDVWLVHVLDRKNVREQVLSVAGHLLPDEIRKEMSDFCLTDSARCVLGRICSLVEQGKAAPEDVADRVVYYHKRRRLYSPVCTDKSIVRCFLMDEKFALRFSVANVCVGREKFVSVPSDYEGIMQFSDMVSVIKERKR